VYSRVIETPVLRGNGRIIVTPLESNENRVEVKNKFELILTDRRLSKFSGIPESVYLWSRKEANERKVETFCCFWLQHFRYQTQIAFCGNLPDTDLRASLPYFFRNSQLQNDGKKT